VPWPEKWKTITSPSALCCTISDSLAFMLCPVGLVYL
jgi:hypothetical protein